MGQPLSEHPGGPTIPSRPPLGQKDELGGAGRKTGWRQPQEERCFPRITVWPSPECLLPGEESCSPPPSHRELYTLTSPSHPQGTPETCDSRTRAMASWLCQPQDFASQEGTGTPQPPPNLAGHRQSRKQGTQQPCTAGCQLGVVMDPSLHQKNTLSAPPISLPLPASSP